MKTSINYLPEQKRDDLRRIVECVLEVLPDCEMIILYGSYARNTYVDYDQRIEYGIRTCFMSDYDILVVTSTRFQRYIINHILSKATDNYYKGKNRYASTTVQFIDESIDDLNKAIDKNRYFYTDIKREGIMLYNSGRYKYDKNDERYKICSFHLHQACENYYNSIILTFTLYSPKEHSLITLSGRAKTHSLESSEAFPRDTEEEKRLFDLLQDAYVQARYNLHFRVTKEDIEALIPKVELLRDITRQCCEERIKVYAAKQRQV